MFPTVSMAMKTSQASESLSLFYVYLFNETRANQVKPPGSQVGTAQFLAPRRILG